MQSDADTAPVASSARVARSLTPGTRLGRFEIVRFLGAGGMGTVYEARDPELGRSVALKVIRTDGPKPGGDASLRLVREAQALAQLQHPNVVSVHDVGVDRGDVFVAMELVDGETLEADLARGTRRWQDVVALFLQAGEGLAAAHARGLVHRDFKATNALVDRQGRVRVTDFGLARVASVDDQPSAEIPPVTPTSSDETTAQDHGTAAPDSPRAAALDGGGVGSDLLGAPLTDARTLLGTPRYMAPEQRARRQATAKSDQYAFCLVLWEALFGDLPPARPGGAGVPRGLSNALKVGLARDPADRHESMAELLRAVRRAAELPRRRLRWALIGAAAIAVGGAFVLARRPAVDCASAGVAASQVWSPAARQKVTRAFTAARGDGAALAAQLVPRLDAWVAGWQAARVDACRATHERGEQSAEMLDRRGACLDGGLLALRSLVSALAGVDTPAMVRAFDAVNALPPVDACEPARLAAPGATNPPARLVRAALAQAQVSFGLGRYSLAAGEAALALAGARAVDDPGLRAQSLLLHARAIASSDGKRARDELEQALADAARAGDRVVEANVALAFMYQLVDEGATERVGALLPATRAAVAAARQRTQEHELAFLEARAAIKARRPKEEISAACGRVAALEQSGDAPRALECLCTAAVNLREAAEGRVQCQRLVDARIALQGPAHPDVATALLNLGNIHDGVGEYAEAIALQERALALTEAAYGDSRRTANVLVNLGNSLSNVGRYAEARDRLERALAVLARASDRPSRTTANVHNTLAYSAAKLGDRDGAVRHADESVKIAEALLGPDNAELVLYLNNKGLVLLELDRPAAALAAFERAVALAERVVRGHLYHGFAMWGQAKALTKLGRAREALPIAEAALHIISRSETDPYNVATSRVVLAQALLATGDRPRARRELVEARKILVGLGPVVAAEVAEIDAMLRR